jgi:hypothetical protein
MALFGRHLRLWGDSRPVRRRGRRRVPEGGGLRGFEPLEIRLAPAGMVSPADAVAESMTTLASSMTAITFGQKVTLTSTVGAAVSGGSTEPTGNVEFFNEVNGSQSVLGTQPINSGVAALNDVALPAGTATITAQYQGDTNFASSTSAVVTVNVAQSSTTTVVTVTPNPSVLGSTATLKATVAASGNGSGTPTGTVEFFNGATNLGSAPLGSDGTASFPTTTLNAGANPITATYEGDSNFLASMSAPVTANVTVATTTTVTASTTTPVFGQKINLTATVAPSGSSSSTPTGMVQFMNGTTALGSPVALNAGMAILQNQTLPLGAASITAQYQGDTNFSPSMSTALPVTVGQAMSSTVVSVSPSPSTFGSSVSVTANVTAVSPGVGTPTGTVEFFTGTTSLGAIALTNGSATIATAALVLGNNAVTAQYRGDTDFNASTSPVFNQSVTQATTTTVSSSPSPSVFGQPVTFTANVSSTGGTPTGTVQFFNNGTSLLGSGTLSGGVATFTTSSLATGFSHITAGYLGDSTFSPSTSASITQAVNQASTTTTISSSPNPSGLGQSVTFTATVIPVSPASGTPTGSVLFQKGTTQLGTATLTNGVATFSTTTLPVGTSAITAMYLADNNFGPSTSPVVNQVVGMTTVTVTVTTSNKNPVVNESVVLTATVAAVNTANGTPTGTVDFFSNGTLIDSGTLANGTASITTTTMTALPIGNQTITAVYQGDSNFTGGATSAGLAMVVGDTNQLYLNKIYLNVFKRTIDSDGLDTWQPLLADGITRQRVVPQIVIGPEFDARSGSLARRILEPKKVPHNHAQLVNSLFETLTGKPADKKSLKTYVGQLNRGVSQNQVVINILASYAVYAASAPHL